MCSIIISNGKICLFFQFGPDLHAMNPKKYVLLDAHTFVLILMIAHANVLMCLSTDLQLCIRVIVFETRILMLSYNIRTL